MLSRKTGTPGWQPGTIGFLLIPQFTVLSLACAIEPLRIANRYLATPYVWRLLSLDGGPVVDDNGIAIGVDASIGQAGPLGCVVVCADREPERWYGRELRRFLHRLDREGTLLCGVDTGSFLLARAGLLGEGPVTVHWEAAAAFVESFPQIPVEHSLFRQAGRRVSCAGGSAVLDMMLDAIRAGHGAHLANRVAEHCQHDAIRDGATTQRMALPTRSGAFHPKLVRAIGLMESVTDRAVTLDQLVDSFGLSARQWGRLFDQHVGETPARYHRRLRLGKAQTLLTRTELPVAEVALACGFGSVAHFCRAYRQLYRVSPGQDRQRLRGQTPMLRDAGPA